MGAGNILINERTGSYRKLGRTDGPIGCQYEVLSLDNRRIDLFEEIGLTGSFHHRRV